MLKFLTALLFCGLLSNNASSETLYPTTLEELRSTSVKIINVEETTGGTGAVFRSFSNASHILTNKHICRIIEQGGYVLKGNRRYLITHYKKYPKHDLCLVRVAKNFNINLEVAIEMPKATDRSYVSGHPSLLPHIVTGGHFTDEIPIELIVALRECKPEDMEEHGLECMFLGGVAVIEEFQSQVVSNLIMPGNSGSSVFNSNGEISGVVFAGNGRGFSFGFIVPHMHVAYFLDNAQQYDWIKVGTPVEEDEIYLDRVFDYSKCQKILDSSKPNLDSLKRICRSIENNMIWRD